MVVALRGLHPCKWSISVAPKESGYIMIDIAALCIRVKQVCA